MNELTLLGVSLVVIKEAYDFFKNDYKKLRQEVATLTVAIAKLETKIDYLYSKSKLGSTQPVKACEKATKNDLC